MSQASLPAPPRTLGADLLALAVCVGVCWAAAAVGSAATVPNIPTWYAELAKPSWNPPSWLFGPVWSVLYTLMGVSAWLVWRTGDPRRAAALAVFAVHLVFNALWSVLFFGFHRPDLAFLDIVALWASIVLSMALFARVHRGAALILSPYLAWVSFAAALNFTIWRLNL